MGQGINLGLQLAADRQAGPPAEKIAGKGMRSLQLGRFQRGDGEHLARALAIGGGDDRGVHLEKAVLVKKSVDGKTEGAPHPGHRAQGIGAGPKMGDGAEKLKTVPFFLQGIGLRDRPNR